MARYERETVATLPSEEELTQRKEEGWKLVAVEWRRPAAGDAAEEARETPYGLCTADGGTELATSRSEDEALRLMLEMVIDDRNSLSAVAEALNSRGFRTRSGQSWSPTAVFNMMPRLVEVAPQIFSRPDWSTEQMTTH